jgi:Leucine-rich repeat (LRR) protein
MKQLLLILLCLPILTLAQKTYVPDDNFENYLEVNGMGDGIFLNDSVLTGNINTVTGIDIDYLGISDLTGIDNFVALTVLKCRGNNLTSLDLSNNTALYELKCKSNQLTSLDVTLNTALTTLYCDWNQLTSLDVSHNTLLNRLYCDDNQITSLDVSQNILLDRLYCNNNQIISLDLTQNTTLTRLNCSSNKLNNIDLRNHNITTFKNFQSSNNLELFCIDVDNPQLAQAVLFGIDPWTSFDTNCVTALGCTDTLAYNYDSTATINDGSCYYGKTYVPDDNFENYLEAFGMGDGIALNDSVLTGSINTVTTLNVDNQNITDLIGIEDFIALANLQCNTNQLTSLDVSNNTSLTKLWCKFNQLTSLDVSANTDLSELRCSYNQLTSLDVSTNTALVQYLICSNNQLTSLDVSNNTLLERLHAEENQITSLDLSNNTSLNELFCNNNNQLTSLDLRNHTLQGLYIGTYNNTNLFCIDVDNPFLAQALLIFSNIDSWTSFDTNCATALGCMDSLSCNYNNTATIADNSCTYLPVTLNSSQVTCTNFSDASLTVNYNTGSYTYLWNNGETTQSIDSLAMGSYSVIVTDTTGCSTSLNANVTLAPAPAFNMFPEICYVTVDSATGNNKVVVKPMANLLTSKFIIYKESSANIYSPIDTINSNALEHLDISSNPMAQSYRYKISVLDTCSNESVKSDFHKTIHLTMSLGLNGEVNLLWNNYEGYQPSDYLIFRSVNNGAMNQVGILPGTNLAFTDLTPPSGILNYQVRAIAPNCNIIPFAKSATNMLVSNVINHSTTAVNELVNSKKVIKITDLLGRETKLTNQPLFYIYDDGTVDKRIVIE